MAYYEMMPAGLPAGLQSGMDSVLNKKFGTATSYAPGTWPADVNLLGPLPEGTASGPIANFSDGADDVPTKSLVVTIAPTLSGVSSVTETQTGSNVWDEVWELGAINVTNGQNVANNNFIRSTNYIPVLPNTVYYKCAPQNYLQLYYGKDKSYLSYGSWNKNTTFTTPSDCYFVRFYVASEYGTTYNNDIALNYPSTFTEYAHYNGTTYTASLGRTIYGGTADIVNGEGQELVKKITVSSFTGTWGAVTNGYAYYISVADTTHSTSVVNPIMMQANQLFTYGSVGRNNAPTWQYGGNDGGTTVHTFILPSEYDTLTKANNFLASLQTPIEVTLTLATPTDFTFTGQEVPTRLGYNAFWSDEGDTEVTYRADISLALQAVSGLRGLMMARTQLEPETEPEETIEETPEEMER